MFVSDSDRELGVNKISPSCNINKIKNLKAGLSGPALGFPTGQDSATFRDNGTEVGFIYTFSSSLSCSSSLSE